MSAPAILITCIALLHAPSATADSSFSDPSARTFSGRIAIEDLFRRLELDYLAGRKLLEPLGIKAEDQVEFWTIVQTYANAPKSVEIHLESGPWLVVDMQTSRVLSYVRYGAYWVSKGRPEESAPLTAKTRDAAIPQDAAAAKVGEWLEMLAPEATWHPLEPVYKDRFDSVEGDLFGAWWDFSFERLHETYPVRGANASISVNAETGGLMRFEIPLFTPPAATAIYFPVANARLQAQLYLEYTENALEELVDFDLNRPEAQIQALGTDFGLRSNNPGKTLKPKTVKHIQKEAKKIEKEAAKAEAVNPNDPDAPAQTIQATPPTLAPGEPTLVIALVHEIYKQRQWQPIDPAHPDPRYALAYEFPTQTPTAPTKPIYVLAATDEVAR